MATLNGIFVVPTADEDLPPPTVRKAANSSVKLAFDFGNLPEIAAGETITGTPTVTVSPSGPTISSVVATGENADGAAPYRVQFTVSGGTATGGTAQPDGTLTGDYTLTCTAAFTGGSSVAATGVLRVF